MEISLAAETDSPSSATPTSAVQAAPIPGPHRVSGPDLQVEQCVGEQGEADQGAYREADRGCQPDDRLSPEPRARRRCRRATGTPPPPALCAAARIASRPYRVLRRSAMSASSGSWSPMSSMTRPEPGDLVADLGVRSAHRGGGVGATEHPVQRRVQVCLLGVLMRPDLACQQVAHLADPAHRGGPAVWIGGERVSGGPDLLDVGPDDPVLIAEPAGERGVSRGQPGGGRGRAQRAQRVEDDGHVDGLLQQRAPHGRQQPGGGRGHRGSPGAPTKHSQILGRDLARTKRVSCDVFCDRTSHAVRRVDDAL